MLERAWFEDAQGIERASHWDARLDTTRTRTLRVRSSGERRVSDATQRSVGVRALVDGAWGFVAVPEPERAPLQDAATEAVRMGAALAEAAKPGVRLAETRGAQGTFALPVHHDPFAMDPVALADGLASLLENVQPGTEASIRLTLRGEQKHVVSANGADARIDVTRVYAAVDATDRETGSSVGRRLGGAGGLELVAVPEVEDALAAVLASLALIVEARPVPDERLPVVVDPELTGVFAHEAVGHGCEADLVEAGDSIFAGLMGEQVGTDVVTIVDDPHRATGFGAFPVDDEGTPAAPRTLVERGVVTGFIHSLETAGAMNAQPNGGGRAEDGSSEPIPRMSNTMFAPGDLTDDELWEQAGRSILVKGTRGGQVDTTRGTFQFTPQEAYLVERGEIVHALSGAGLSGTVLGTLRSVEAATRSQRLGGPGMCGKGQWVPVGDGGPHILVTDVEVG